MQSMLVAEVLHDRAALPDRPARKTGFLEERREVGGVFREKLRGALPPPHVFFFELEIGGADEDAHAKVVDARLENAQVVVGHRALLDS